MAAYWPMTGEYLLLSAAARCPLWAMAALFVGCPDAYDWSVD